ncbi:hypothetical protein STX56_09680 [Streptococcus agalactiae]
MKALITKWYLFCPYLASLFALALFFGNWDLRVQSPRRTHENFLFILLCPDINFEKIPF